MLAIFERVTVGCERIGEATNGGARWQGVEEAIELNGGGRVLAAIVQRIVGR